MASKWRFFFTPGKFRMGKMICRLEALSRLRGLNERLGIFGLVFMDVMAILGQKRCPASVYQSHLVDTVDGWNPANQLIGSLSHYLQGFIHPRWCRISSINSSNTHVLHVWNIYLDLFKMLFYFLPWQTTILHHHLGEYVWNFFQASKSRKSKCMAYLSASAWLCFVSLLKYQLDKLDDFERTFQEGGVIIQL